MKSEKGITLIMLVTYIVMTTIALAVLATITNYFYNNVYSLENKAMYAAEFNKFNVYIVQDVKNNTKVNIQVPTTEQPYLDTVIAFGNGNRYIYYNNPESSYKNKIYRITRQKDAEGNPIVKENGSYQENIALIATNVTKFQVNTRTVNVEDVQKTLLDVELQIGTHEKMRFWHTITYTLKYW